MGWRDSAREQSGVISRLQLRESGLTDTAIARMTTAGELTQPAPRVFLVGGAPLTFRARLWVAVLSTDGIVGFATAARLWGALEDHTGAVHLILPHARRVYPPKWVRLHRVPVPRHATTTMTGLAITTRSWSVLDVLTTLGPGPRERLADRALQRGWIQVSDINRRLLGYPGRTGNTALRLLAQQAGDGAAAKSERIMHDLLRQAGIDGWVPNYRLWHEGELIGVIDLALPDKRLAIEVDGWAYHQDIDRFQRDRTRQNDLIALGWSVLRFTWADLTQRPGYVRAMVRALAA